MSEAIQYFNSVEEIKEQPVISWIEQIEQVREETVQVNFVENKVLQSLKQGV